jgi:putative transposase
MPSGWGGRRKGAGRKPRPENIGLLPHAARPKLARDSRVAITLRTAEDAPSLRDEDVAAIVEAELSRVSEKGFRVVRHSVTDDELELVAVAEDGVSLSRGMQRLASRITLGINLARQRRGSLWRERYTRRDLSRAKRQGSAKE